AFDRARDRLEAVGAPDFLATLAVHEGHLDRLRPDGSDAARARLDDAKRGSARTRSWDVRTAMRILERALRSDGRLSAALEWTIGPSARWFLTPPGSRVSLSRRAPIRRMLEALVAHRFDAPGRALDSEALVFASWPGESIARDTGRQRVRVAIS